MVQTLLLGLGVTCDGREATISLTPDLKDLELDAPPTRKRRLPVSQITDVSFGRGDSVLSLQFSDISGAAPLEIDFGHTEMRLHFALAMKVLRAKHTGELLPSPLPGGSGKDVTAKVGSSRDPLGPPLRGASADL